MTLDIWSGLPDDRHERKAATHTVDSIMKLADAYAESAIEHLPKSRVALLAALQDLTKGELKAGEPVAVVQMHPDGRRRVVFKDSVTDCDAAWQETQKLYAAPQPAQPAQPEHEPPCCGNVDSVRWNTYNGVVQCHSCGTIYTASSAKSAQPVALPQPLTNQQIGEILADPGIAEMHQGNWLVLPYTFARAIEKHHGIGAKE
jgi:hypothetical protein